MELEKLTALQLGEKIKQRQVSVLDGVKTVFEQIEKQDSEVHAYLDTYKEEAYKRAEEVQKGIEDGTYTSPLAGVPIAIKDNICINGKKTTCASKILENFVPQYNAEVIDRLERAGLVIIGKTTWMNLPWEVQQRPPLTASPETHGIWNTYRADLPVDPVQQWQQEKLTWHSALILVVLSGSQVLTVA